MLPERLNQALKSSGLTRIQQNHARKLCHIILSDTKLRGVMLADKYKELPKNYMRAIFNSKYLEWFTLLKEKNILQPLKVNGRETYDGDKGLSKRYRINPELLNVEMVRTDYYEKTNENPSLYVATFLTNTLARESIYNDFDVLTINREKLLEATDKYVAKICRSRFKVDEQIEATSIEIIDRQYQSRYWTSIEKAKKRAEREGKNVIQDGSKFYLQNLDEFVRDKKQQVNFSWKRMIESLCFGHYYASRNETNFRLDTNYTNLPGVLLDIIKEDNNLIELDVHNCQFALISHLYEKLKMPQTDNFLFYEYYARRGLLYEFIRIQLELDSRSQAKKLMFEMCFSARRYSSPGKSKLKELFPDVMNFIDEFKKENGDKSFPIELQRLESDIFIDHGLCSIKEVGFFCISRHDSLLVRESDAEAIYRGFCKIIHDVQFRCTVDCEWDKEMAWIEDYERAINQSFDAA